MSVRQLLDKAKEFKQAGDREASLQCLRDGLSRYPQNVWVPIEIAEDLRALGRLGEAEAILHDALERLPESALLWNQLGLVALFQDQAEKAVDCFETGVSLQPAHPICYLSLLNEFLRVGRLEEAGVLLDEAMRHVPDTKNLELVRVRLLKSLGDYEAALGLAENLVERYPDDFFCANVLVDLYVMTGATRAAIDTLVLLMVPGNLQQRVICQVLKARISLIEFDVDSALRHVESALLLNDKNVSAYQLLTKIQLMRGDSVAARSALQKANELLKNSASARNQAFAGRGFFFEIWKECSLNPYAERALADCLNAPVAQKVQKIVDVLRDEPNYVGGALALLASLRHMRVWDQVCGPVSVTAKEKIPRRIVQFWDTPEIPQDILLTMQSWRVMCPGFEYAVFNDETGLAFLEAHCDSDVIKAFRMANHPAMRSDLFRLAYLFIRGGVYVDADDKCRFDIAPWLDGKHALFLLQEQMGSIGNNFIAAAPAHPFIRSALAQVVANILGKQGDWIWFVSGPGVLTVLFCQFYIEELRRCRLPAGVMVKDAYRIQRNISIHLPRAYKHDDRGWLSSVAAASPLFRN